MTNTDGESHDQLRDEACKALLRAIAFEAARAAKGSDHLNDPLKLAEAYAWISSPDNSHSGRARIGLT